MTHTIPNFNAFTIDDERRLALRSEVKRSLAEIAVKKQKAAELEEIVAKLDADSDDAADQHTTAASALQSELDGLDAENIEAILDGKKATAKSSKRRREIMEELTALNQELEIRVEANRRSSGPIRKQAGQLRMETTAESALKNTLAELCSIGLRQRILINRMQFKGAVAATNECERVLKVFSHNRDIFTQNRAEASESSVINQARTADHEAAMINLRLHMKQIEDSGADLRRQALDE